VEQADFVFEGTRLPITISLGVATARGSSFQAAAELVAAADRQLYRSKQGGRNRTSFASAASSDGGGEPAR
jgi:PleD family two-component response regulator